MSGGDKEVNVEGDEARRLDCVVDARLAFIVAVKGKTLADSWNSPSDSGESLKLGGKTLADSRQSDRDSAKSFTGRSRAPRRGQVLHLLLNRLSKGAFKAMQSEDPGATCTVSIHWFGTHFDVDYKRTFRACTDAEAFGLVTIRPDNSDHTGVRRYRLTVEPKVKLLKYMQDSYLPFVRDVFSSISHEVDRWIKRSDERRRRPPAFQHGIYAEDVVLVDAALRLTAAWKFFIETIMDTADADGEAYPPETDDAPVSPAECTSRRLVQSEVAYHLVHRVFLLSARSSDPEKTKLILAKFAKRHGVSLARVKSQVALIVEHGWVTYVDDDGNVCATQKLFFDFKRFYLPALRTVWDLDGSKGKGEAR